MLATKRLTRELKLLHDDPPIEFIVKCDEKDMLKWYFLIYGSPDTPYEGGLYVGELQKFSKRSKGTRSPERVLDRKQYHIQKVFCLETHFFCAINFKI
ncbi:MAG: hypothetical protein EOP45_16580 [Sphingobacteriaceae bacterium]|nr:MAG: hypothetical protein EOP45_16580 [Sphingobacteriaceae bacterium]